MTSKTRNASFNAMVRFFLQYYNIPTRKDFDKIINCLDRIEKAVQAMNLPASPERPQPSQPRVTESSTALDVIRDYKDGVDFAGIKSRTGFDDKKIRNIIFRLDKIGKIKRIRRGIYVAR
jgi:hypothetical protein